MLNYSTLYAKFKEVTSCWNVLKGQASKQQLGGTDKHRGGECSMKHHWGVVHLTLMEATGSAPKDEMQVYYNFISLNWNTEILPYASNSLWGFLRSSSCQVCTNNNISLDFWGSLCFHTESNLPHNWRHLIFGCHDLCQCITLNGWQKTIKRDENLNPLAKQGLSLRDHIWITRTDFILL